MNESDEHSLYKADSLSDSDSDDYQFESSGVLDHILNKYRHLQSLTDRKNNLTTGSTTNVSQQSNNSGDSTQIRATRHIKVTSQSTPFAIRSFGPQRPLSATRHSISSDTHDSPISSSLSSRSSSPFKAKSDSPSEHNSTKSREETFSSYSALPSNHSWHDRSEFSTSTSVKRQKRSPKNDPISHISHMGYEVDQATAKKTMQDLVKNGVPDIPTRRHVHWKQDQEPNQSSLSHSFWKPLPAQVNGTQSPSHVTPSPKKENEYSARPRPPSPSSSDDEKEHDEDDDIFKRPFDVKDIKESNKENYPPPPLPLRAPVHVQSSNSNAPTIGSEIRIQDERYIVLGKIGTGGSSEVFEVVSQKRECKFAIKCVKINNVDKSVTDGYKDEIRLLRKLNRNDRIVCLYQHEIRHSEQTIYMVLELGSIDFAHLLAKRKGQPLNYHFLRYYWQQMLEAVAAIHELKIVHSDLKPANFILVHDTLKLIDFGIAKAISNDTTNIQRENQLGTLNYMSPETLRGTDQDGNLIIKHGRPSDVWSLGCILYQMVYGSPPFYAFTQQLSKMQAILNPSFKIKFSDTLKYDNHPDVLVQESLLDALKSCLEREPKHRKTIPELLKHPFLQ
ncbi:serine threonine-protein kinase mph1 [Lichtheimia corymbifera JMRC:FSU:9682]|uniref:Serine threonine-protein kinase mph1 n=1 Tax=Lichtheimia corymbifera JMRC:FSU:9682 TaxID=1263082 RepID=A0A068RPC6_9FUNG|nr:serine threonine-protein kinase mph1 [Lichtheimia corymbifera JMRC:FSU:9682]